MDSIHPLVFIAVIVVIWFAGKQIMKKIDQYQARKYQKNFTDKIVEKNLMDGLAEISIELLAKHSDKEKIAIAVSCRIVDLIRLSIHPEKLSVVFEKLGLFMVVKNHWSMKEIELSALIQQYVLRNIDSHDLEVYQIEVSKDRKNGFQKLNTSFLVKAPKDMLVWGPKLN